MAERVSGVRVRGSCDDWRPKAHDELGEEVSEPTVAQARIVEGVGEQAGQESP
ncbi:DUF5828 family protein [Haloarcula amylolytica]|uniref:DUF5828 family protein n=1 Tax=Haloarcula amylolytica TaxID=396317 RepID=UPI003C743414